MREPIARSRLYAPHSCPYAHGALGTLVSMLFDAVVGIVIGIGVLLVVMLASRLRKPKTLPTG